MTNKLIHSLFLLALFLFTGSILTPAQNIKDSRDGKEYRTVQIGNQVWIAQNLAYIKGDGFVPATKEAVASREFEQTTCYNKDHSNCEKFGMLYTWKTAQDVCPAGWHLPAKEEYDTLIISLGDEKNQYAQLINDWGGQFIFAGRLYMTDDLYVQRFLNLNETGLFWTSTKTKYYAYVFTVNKKKRRVKMNDQMRNCGLSVRCIKD